MPMKLLKSIGLILGTLGIFVIVGAIKCLVFWIVLFVLFIISRFSKRVILFTEWSWPQFLVTIGCALGLPYIWLILSAGF
jgi:hypothetical protein